jgi:hypothetical protein
MAQPAGVTISFTEAQGFTVLGNFLQSICAPSPLPIVRQIGNTAPGVNSRVPEPAGGDFIVMSSLSQPRLATNLTTYSDVIFTGSVAVNVLTVTAVAQGTIEIGSLFLDGNYPPVVLPGSMITGQLTGSPGGIGTYSVSGVQTVSSGTLYAGIRTDVATAEWIVQLNIHGPNSANNTRTIDTLFRSDYAVDYFTAQGQPLAPLYCDDPRQATWENAEQQMEFDWTIDLHMEIDVAIGTPQQFADVVTVRVTDASTLRRFSLR